MATSALRVRGTALVITLFAATACSTVLPPGSPQPSAPPPEPPPLPTATAGASPSGLVTPSVVPAESSGVTPEPTPLVEPTATPSVSPTPAPSASATPAVTPEPTAAAATLAEQPGLQEALDAISNGTIQIPATIPFFGDGLGTLYLPHDGSAATVDAPHIDTTGASAFGHDLTDGQATALSSHVCGSEGQRDDVSFYMSCNQPGPMPAGEYIVFISTFGAGLPDPFPEAAQCVYSFQSDVDGDAATGFQSPLEYNYLTGADVYYETLFFWNEAGDFLHYILATDHSRPPRSDTGEIHGNLPTSGRSFNLTSNGYAGHIAFVPTDQWGDNFTAGGFCNEDRSQLAPDNFAVDALGNPEDPDFPLQIQLALDIFFPPRE